MKVDIVTCPAIRLGVIKHRGSYSTIDQAFAKLSEIVDSTKLAGPGKFLVGVYLDDPMETPEADLRSEACITVDAATKLPPGLSERVIAAGRFAKTTYVGPYEGLPDVWGKFMGEWFPQSGAQFGDDVSYELYRNTPADTPDEKLITELYVSVA